MCKLNLGSRIVFLGLSIFSVFSQESVDSVAVAHSPGIPNPDLKSPFITRLSDNLRWTVDLSVKGGYSTTSQELESEQTVGVDLYKVFSTETRDWATLVFQLYLTRINNAERYPGFFDSSDDWELLARSSFIDFRLLPNGQLNLRAGHIEVPFGLEPSILTQGTLMQLLTGPNLGVIADWGVGLNGTIEKVRYDFLLSRGSGMEYRDEGGPFAISGRIGRAVDSETFLGSPGVGISGFYGEILTPSGLLERSRLALDAIGQFRSFGSMAELSVGQDANRDVLNALIEVNWQSPQEIWVLYAQSKHFNKRFVSGWDSAWTTALGVRLTPDNHWAWSAQYENEMEGFGSARRRGFFALQARYRF